jgi:general secretion pathway protein F
MAEFQYEAVDADGRTLRGTMEAATPRAARHGLRARGLIPLRVEASSQSSLDSARWGAARPVLRPAELTVWTRRLAGLLQGGLPLDRALDSLLEDAVTKREARLVRAIQSDIRSGSSLSAALRNHSHTFDSVFCSVVDAGEQAGELAAVLASLAADLEERQLLRAKVLAASLYPMVVSVVAICVTGFLVAYVVPQVAGVFQSSRRPLPSVTLWLLTVSNWLREWGWLFLPASVCVVAASVWAYRMPKIRLRIDGVVLRAPLLGPLWQSHQTARLAGTMSLLLAAGVPLVRALQSACATLTNAAMRHDGERAVEMLKEGASLTSALASQVTASRLLARFTALGEQTGELSASLGSVSRQLSAEVQRKALALATLLEPALIILMGLVVLVVVFAVLLPIIQMNALVR